MSDFAFELLSREDEWAVLLERTSRTDDGSVRSRALALLNIGPIGSDEGVGYGDCRKDGKTDAQVVAVYLRDDERYFDSVSRAWVADTTGHAFKQIPASGIDCENVSYGV